MKNIWKIFIASPTEIYRFSSTKRESLTTLIPLYSLCHDYPQFHIFHFNTNLPTNKLVHAFSFTTRRKTELPCVSAILKRYSSISYKRRGHAAARTHGVLEPRPPYGRVFPTVSRQQGEICHQRAVFRPAFF